MRLLRFPAIVAAVVGSVGYLASQVPVAYAQSVNTNPVPVATGCTVSTTSSQCIAANPTRRSIQICNPSANVAVWIAPGSTAAVVNGAGSISIPPVASNVTTCITPPTGAGGGNTNVGAAWNAITALSPGVLTILEYF
jgi:hypothetical protein